MRGGVWFKYRMKKRNEAVLSEAEIRDQLATQLAILEPWLAAPASPFYVMHIAGNWFSKE